MGIARSKFNMASRMTSVFARTSLRRVARRRYTSDAHYEAEVASMNRWRNVTVASVPLIFGLFVYNVLFPQENPPRKEYPYMRIRKKDFPWGDKDLFDRYPRPDE